MTPSQTVAEMEKSLDMDGASTPMIDRTQTRENSAKVNMKGSPRINRVPYKTSIVEIGEYPS